MERKVSGQYVDVLSTAIIVLFLDVFLIGYFSMTDAYNNHTPVAVDVLLVILAILLGRKTVKLMDFPVWQKKYYWEIDKRQFLISVLIGSCIILLNAMVLLNSDISSIAWLKFSKFHQPYLLALRAALTEELLYRFFIFSFIAEIVCRVFNSRAFGIISGTLISSFLFGLLHQGFYLSFVFGLGLCYIYKNNGLIFVMGVHFLADFIPFMLIYLR